MSLDTERLIDKSLLANSSSYFVIRKPQDPCGYWILYSEGSITTRFAMYHKPPFIQRWFTNKLLGWTWKDH